MPAGVIELLVAVVELAAKVGPDIYEAIKSNGEYSDEQKVALTARVKAAQQAVRDYVPREI